jgi:galactokinase
MINKNKQENMDSIQSSLIKLYGNEKKILQYQQNRYQKLFRLFNAKFGKQDVKYFSTPGRTEIGGNHTDHNNGCVLAAAVNLDSIAVAAGNDSNKVIIFSEGYEKPFEINLNNTKVVPTEKNSTQSLIRGIAARFIELGYRTGGFNAFISSDVLPGSGLSSSASIEVLIASIFNKLFNRSVISPVKIAAIGQYAENVYFGKPCGLMDQTACSFGGVIAIDFKNPNQPFIEQVDFNMEKDGYSLIVLNTGGNHVDLTEDYASIPSEMGLVAQFFGKKVLRGLTRKQLTDSISTLRNRSGDRAILRALHFVEENKRIQLQKKALKENRFKDFLSLINESGLSSYCYLQNVISQKEQKEQSMALALELTSSYIKSTGEGACRLHGGGFAGTILVFLPDSKIKKYIKFIETVFGQGCVSSLKFRFHGAVCLSDL